MFFGGITDGNVTPPAVSVLIPTHDRPQLLREAIASVLGNGFEDLEIIVSDDSPSGSAREVAASFGDSRLKYFHNPPPGAKAGNWDYAARQASGTYCFKLDDDDRILPGFLRRCIEVLDREPDVASVYTAYRVTHDSSAEIETVIDHDFFGARGRVGGEAYLRAVLTNEGGYPRNQKTAGVFRRSAAEKINFYHCASEDFAFSAALGLFGHVAYVPEVLYEWRIHGGSGVKDLGHTYRLSDAACEGLLRLPQEVIPAGLSAQWECLVGVTRRALPLFYLKSAFGVDRGEGWKFWRLLKKENIVLPQPAATLCLALGLALPRRLFRAMMSEYQRGGIFQKLARWMARL